MTYCNELGDPGPEKMTSSFWIAPEAGGRVSGWISQNYWRGGWRSWLANLLNDIGNRWPGLLP